MKRASYRDGVVWIATLAESKKQNQDSIPAADTTRLLAKLFGVDEELVAIDVRKRRRLLAFAAKESEELDDLDFDDDGEDDDEFLSEHK